MQIEIGTLTRCDGNSHLHIPVTISGVERRLTLSRDELQGDPGADLEAAKEAVIQRIRSAVKEATTGVPTWAEIQTALNGKVFEV